MPAALELKGIEAGYGDMPALFGVDLRVPQGSVTALLGPNGAGKSTTLRVAGGIVKASRGTVVLNGDDVTKKSVRELAPAALCLVLEGRSVFPALTVRENLLIQTHLRGRAAADDIEEIAYGRFPALKVRRSQMAGTMSGGEQQMLALSRVLTTNPSVVLLDEISMGLAPMVVEELFGVVRQLADDGLSVLLVEQLAQGAMNIADYVYVLNHGRVRSVGQPADIRDTIVDTYMGSSANVEQSVGPSVEGSMVVTAHGTVRHYRSCAVVAAGVDVRPIAEQDRFPQCALCEPARVLSLGA